MPSRVPLLSNHIRPFDSNHDLHSVADLIDICFGYQMDQDGLDYLRYIRQVALGERTVRWVDGAGERISVPLFGYVWEENHRVVGNISLSPFQWRKRWYYLIANVAVHPDFRRRGIAKQLTLQAIEHCRHRNVDHVWLQVKDFNQPAIHLYEQLGFVEKARRTNWRSSDLLYPPELDSQSIHVIPRLKRDWNRQQIWLAQAYPEDVRWYFGIYNEDLAPGIIRSVSNYLLYEQVMHHFSAYLGHELIGVMTQQPINNRSHHLYLTLPAGKHEQNALKSLLTFAQRMYGEQYSLRLNYPADRTSSVFEEVNFHPQNTLIWMEYAHL